jgi:hypothetical protein
VGIDTGREVSMPKKKRPTRVAQVGLFHHRIETPRWSRLPSALQATVAKLIAQMLREYLEHNAANTEVRQGDE